MATKSEAIATAWRYRSKHERMTETLHRTRARSAGVPSARTGRRPQRLPAALGRVDPSTAARSTARSRPGPTRGGVRGVPDPARPLRHVGRRAPDRRTWSASSGSCSTAGCGEVDPVVVTAAERGRGIGRALLAKVAEEARRRGLTPAHDLPAGPRPAGPAQPAQRRLRHGRRRDARRSTSFAAPTRRRPGRRLRLDLYDRVARIP